jgi:hypothetical protein
MRISELRISPLRRGCSRYGEAEVSERRREALIGFSGLSLASVGEMIALAAPASSGFMPHGRPTLLHNRWRWLCSQGWITGRFVWVCPCLPCFWRRSLAGSDSVSPRNCADSRAQVLAVPNAPFPVDVLVESPALTKTDLQAICLFRSNQELLKDAGVSAAMNPRSLTFLAGAAHAANPRDGLTLAFKTAARR